MGELGRRRPTTYSEGPEKLEKALTRDNQSLNQESNSGQYFTRTGYIQSINHQALSHSEGWTAFGETTL
jgi:hypothetical protein